MIAKQTVWLAQDRKTAVPQGDKRARFKLVHAGHEISEDKAKQFDGAIKLIGGTKKAPAPEPERKIETREPEPQHRDPKHHGKGK